MIGFCMYAFCAPVIRFAIIALLLWDQPPEGFHFRFVDKGIV